MIFRLILNVILNIIGKLQKFHWEKVYVCISPRQKTLSIVSERHENKCLFIQDSSIITDHREKKRILISLFGTEMDPLELHTVTFMGIFTGE